MANRLVEGFEALNANIRRKIGTKDLDGSTEGNGVVPAAVAPYISVAEYGDSHFHKTVLTCTALPLSIADDAGQAQYGGVLVYTFPLGLITTQMCRVAGNLTLGTTGTIIAAFTGVNALGTVTASTGATLVSTEATYLQSTANATASGSVAAINSFSIATALTEAASRTVNGTSTAAPMFLNFAIADDASHTAGTGSFTGTISFVWSKI